MDSDSISGYSLKRFYVKMLHDPFIKRFHLPSIFIQQCYVFCSDSEVVSQIGETAFRKKLNKLTENIFPLIHIIRFNKTDYIYNFKATC